MGRKRSGSSGDISNGGVKIKDVEPGRRRQIVEEAMATTDPDHEAFLKSLKERMDRSVLPSTPPLGQVSEGAWRNRGLGVRAKGPWQVDNQGMATTLSLHDAFLAHFLPKGADSLVQQSLHLTPS